MTKTTIVATPHGRVRVHLSGPEDGPPLVFVHGALVSSSIWAPLIERLSGTYRCIAPDLPLGSHSIPLEPGADCSPPGVADLCVELLDALGITRATLVGNDSGGAVSQLVAALHPERVERLLLTNCDAFEVMPPAGYEYIRLFRYAWLGRMGARMFTRFPWLGQLPLTWAPLAKRIDNKDIRAWTEPMANVDGIARDFAKFAAEARPEHTLAAAEELRGFEAPVRLVWGGADRFLTTELARRLAAHVPDGELVVVEGAKTYVMLDAPDAVAGAIEGWVPVREAARRLAS